MTRQRTCIFYTNCQQRLLFGYLESSPEFSRNYKIDRRFPLAHKAIRRQLIMPARLLADCELFIYQPIDSKHGERSTDHLLTKLPSDCQCISFPYIYFSGYWPQKSINLNREYLKILSYKDYVTHEMTAKEYSSNDIIQELSKIDFYDKDFLLRNVESTLDELSRREAMTDIKIANFIREHYRNYYLFHESNHPSDIIGFNVVNQILRILKMPVISKPHGVEILGYYQAPIYPSTIAHLGLTFVDRNSTYKHYSQRITFNESIEEYLRRYQILRDRSLTKAPQEYFFEGERLKQEGQTEAAIENYKNAIDGYPDYVEAFRKLAEIYEDTGELSQAIACYERIIELRPNRARNYIKLAELLQLHNQSDEAIAAYKKAIELKPEVPVMVYLKLAEALKNRGQVREAIAICQKALELNPESETVRKRLLRYERSII